MFKRLVVVAVSALVAASFGIPAASAQDEFGSFTLTVNKKAPYANQFKTVITLSGTYTCSPEGFTPDQDFSGIGGGVTQIQRGSLVVTGGGGFGPIECDSTSHPWSFEVPANFGGGPTGGTPATWKNGKAAVNVQGNANVAECQPEIPCPGIWAYVDRVIQIG